MGKLNHGKQTANVNVTLDPATVALPEIQGKELPCPVCGEGLPILISIRNKPYCTCNSCGIQIFVRGKAGIEHLRQLALDGILISSHGGSASRGIAFVNRLERLKLQRRDLISKRPLIFSDLNVENAIDLVDAEINTVQGELAKIASSMRKEPHK